jgi:hypothetical protein
MWSAQSVMDAMLVGRHEHCPFLLSWAA